MAEIVYQEIIPKVHVYKNAIPHYKEFYELLKESHNRPVYDNNIFTKWEDWYGFGLFMDTPMVTEENNMLVKDDDDEYLANQKLFVNEISKAFYTCTEHYMSMYPLEVPYPDVMGISVGRYRPQDGEPNEYAMHYHTDYNPVTEKMPQKQFIITCTMYLNDDYVGGDVMYLVDDTKEVVRYKPSAGDLCIFPAVAPYYHGVKKVTEGYKYLIRTYRCNNHPGDPEWLESRNKYGEDEWAKMEGERIKRESYTGEFHFHAIEPGQTPFELDHSTPLIVTKISDHIYDESKSRPINV